jgi:hypothetical protein
MIYLKSCLALIVAIAVCTGCAGVNVPKLDPTGKYKPNYVVIHPDGYALNDKNTPLTTQGLSRDLKATVIPQVSHFAEQIQMKASPLSSCSVNGETVLRLLVFVHGGLNGYDASFQHMRDLIEEVKDSHGHTINLIKGTCYYPLFVSWDSALFSSFADDLFRIRFGRPDAALAIISSPFVIVSRLITSIASLPVSVIHNGDLFVERIQGAHEEGDPAYCIALDTAVYFPLLALSLATLPLEEGFGAPAWDIMKRRVQLAVADQLTDEPGTQNKTLKWLARQDTHGQAAPFLEEGAFRTLLKVLHESMTYDEGVWKWADSNVRVEVTLVGHSMGSMLLNRTLHLLQGVKNSQKTPVANLVYLAPAAPIEELDTMAIPYLERMNHGKGARDNPTKLSIFTLNRRDEAREIDWFPSLGLVPRGSLLALIDTFLESETTWGQSTSGRTWNLMHAYGVEPVSTSPGTKNCFTPYWDASNGLPPESLPLQKQFRERKLIPGSAHRVLQDRGLLKLYDSPRRVGADNVPEYHGEFSKPQFFIEALCQIDDRVFRSDHYCQQQAGKFGP